MSGGNVIIPKKNTIRRKVLFLSMSLHQAPNPFFSFQLVFSFFCFLVLLVFFVFCGSFRCLLSLFLWLVHPSWARFCTTRGPALLQLEQIEEFQHTIYRIFFSFSQHKKSVPTKKTTTGSERPLFLGFVLIFCPENNNNNGSELDQFLGLISVFEKWKALRSHQA